MTGEAAERFTAFDTSHQVALVLLVLGAFALVWIGRATREGDPDDRIGKGLAVAVLLLTVPLQVIYFTPDYWDLQTALPLQLCDLAALAFGVRPVDPPATGRSASPTTGGSP